VDLAGARVAVTGAGGFIGSAVCRRLLEEGAEPVGLDLPQAQARVDDLGVPFVACDVSDPDATARALDGAAGVVHTAAIVSDWGPMEDFVRVNVRGTRNVLDGAAGAERVVHLSSVAIWGHSFARDVDEDSPPRQAGAPYQDTKGASDVLARRRGAAVVRPGDVFGPGSIPWSHRPLEALRAGRLAIPHDAGLLTPVYVDDLADCIVRALVHPDAAGESFVGWEGPPTRVGDYFDACARMVGRRRAPRLPAQVLTALAAADELSASVRGRPPTVTRWAIAYLRRRAAYRARRAREVLGWRPRVSMQEGLERTERWARDAGLLG
jgi:nucleoside-diphosphate-sugar epimerase